MTTYWISPTGGGDGSTIDSCWTLAQANANLKAGDRALLRRGDYLTTIAPANSGSKDAPITYAGGESLVNLSDPSDTDLLARCNLSGRSYITLTHMHFLSTASMWIDTDAASHHIIVEDCDFDSSMSGKLFAFSGVELLGDYSVFRNNIVNTWCGGNAVTSSGDYLLFEDNDFNQSNNGHGCHNHDGSYGVIRGNTFRNNWARAGEVVSKDGQDAVGNLIEDNIYFDCGWRPDSTPQGWATKDQTGDAQQVKLGGTGTIFRNNLIVSSNPGQPTLEPYASFIQLANYGPPPPREGSYYWRNMRIYHNTFTDLGQHAFSCTYNNTMPMYADDNRWLNNIICDSTTHSFFMRVNWPWIKTWQWHGNILTEPVSLAATNYDAVDLNTNTDGLFPHADGNMSVKPTFADPHCEAEKDDRSKTLDPTKYKLAEGSAGKRAATPLATVTAASSGSTLTVSDALCFYPGYGESEGVGDMIFIGPLGQTIVTGIVDATHITISPAIHVQAGDEIWLEQYGIEPDIGISFGPQVIEPIPPVEEAPAVWIVSGTMIQDGDTAQLNLTLSKQVEI